MCAYAAKHNKRQEKDLNKSVKFTEKYSDLGLQVIFLDLDLLHVVIFFNPSFASNFNLESLLGFVIGFADKQERGNIVLYSSFKLSRDTHSVLATELFADVHLVDYAFSLRE